MLPGAQAIFVECKRPDTKASREQHDTHEFLRSLGFRVEVLQTLTHYAEFIRSLRA